ncbi:MAG: hypothetical protein AMJ72_05715 [Acidithiobacillales bacterium SM1_46]|jgi:hypothetical protein|nr:MAG: hypothetical protein AMJ72_05715 [Acidithiobacillales bacterium SM1_46]
MSYSLVVKQTSNHLHAVVTGDNTVETVRRYLDELAQVCARHGCACLLIEENLDGPSFSTTDVYSVVVEAARKVPSSLREIAFVDANPEHLLENVAFAETVAVNRGVNVRRFETVAQAVHWLRSGAEADPTDSPT